VIPHAPRLRAIDAPEFRMAEPTPATAPAIDRGEQFFDSKDGARLFMRWSKAASPAAAVLVVHGYGDHSGRYQHVIDAFAGAGFATYGVDYRGHGQASGRRAYVANFPEYLDDLQASLDFVRAQSPGLPILIVAHSHGALVTGTYFTTGRAAPDVKAVVFSSPYFQLRIEPSWFQLFQARVVGKVIPFLPVKSPLTYDQLTHDPEFQKKTENDPLYGRSVTPKWFTESTAAQGVLLAAAGKFTLPLLTIQGAEDPIANPAGSQAFHDAAGSADKTYRALEGMKHEVFNEIGREPLIADVVAWLRAHVKA